MSIRATERAPRKPDERAAVNASGMTWLLMNLDGEWVIVDWSGFVT